MVAPRFERRTVGAYVADVLVAPGRRDEDRVALRVTGDGVAFALADGAGNSGRGRVAAERVITARLDGDAATVLGWLDRQLSEIGAEAAAVIASLRLAETIEVRAALAGDARLWVREGGDWRALSEGVPRKPLVGSGAVPSARTARGVDALLCASDGLAAWSGPELDGDVLAHDDAVFRLADRVRLASGALADDVSIVWIRRAT